MKDHLDCAICGEPVNLSAKRRRELLKEGRRPVCRKNGCYRYAKTLPKNIKRVSAVEGMVINLETGKISRTFCEPRPEVHGDENQSEE